MSELQSRNYDLDLHHPSAHVLDSIQATTLLADYRRDQQNLDEVCERVGKVLRETVTGLPDSDQCVVAEHLAEFARIPGGVDYAWKTVIAAVLQGHLRPASEAESESQPDAVASDSEGPWELPVHWKWARLGDLSESVLGKMLDKDKNKGEYRPYLRNTNVRWFGFDLSDLKEMRFEDREFDRYALLRGDVVVCEGGEPGRAAVWGDDPFDMRIQKALHRVRCGPLLRPEWLVYTLRGLADNGSLKEYFTGIGIQHLTGASLRKVWVPLPPLSEQDQMMFMLQNAYLGIAELKSALESRISN